MKKTYSNIYGVLGIVFLTQFINSEIGSYQEHSINECFNFTVQLSNGTINMTLEDAQDYEAYGSLTLERIEIIAKTFKKTE